MGVDTLAWTGLVACCIALALGRSLEVILLHRVGKGDEWKRAQTKSLCEGMRERDLREMKRGLIVLFQC